MSFDLKILKFTQGWVLESAIASKKTGKKFVEIFFQSGMISVDPIQGGAVSFDLKILKLHKGKF